MVEQLTLNQRVTGSSPVTPTNRFDPLASKPVRRRMASREHQTCYASNMMQIEDRFQPLQAVVEADELKGLAHVENELTACLSAYPDAPQKIAALQRLKEQAGAWPKNDLSRYLLLRIEDRRRHLTK